MNNSLARSTKFNIRADLDKSYGSYVVDKNTNRQYLDFFSMYASLPLGYNHEVFHTEEFQRDILKHARTKITNCEFISDETEQFDKSFQDFAGSRAFSNYHYACTGALAIEAAIKTSIIYKGHKKPKIVSFDGAFHGINSYGCFTTSRKDPLNSRLIGLPEIFSQKISPLTKKEDLEKILNEDTTCVLVEPIMSSYGDLYHDIGFLKNLREITNNKDIPLIFDEIQVGFCSTGDVWYADKINITPDIIVFGKKVQLSGIMVKEKFAKIFEKPIMLEVTWDGNPVDMIRGKYVIDACKKYDLLGNVNKQSSMLRDLLDPYLEKINFRNSGFIMAFDLESTEQRDKVVKDLYDKGMLVNSTGNRTIRLRPNLATKAEEIKTAAEILSCVLAEL